MPVAKKKTKGAASQIDAHVGHRLRVRRSLLGLSQEKVAEAIGLTFQQVQKYERGMNRVSAGRLFQFSAILDVPVSYFFENFKASPENKKVLYEMADNDQQDFMAADVIQSKETINLVRAYYSIEDESVRRNIFNFVKSMADNARLGKIDD